MLADECMTALDHDAVQPVMLAALDAAGQAERPAGDT